ncbi:MAG: hypothetical protein JKY34_06035 [Kordiimonadaceae bacterium]|nr:hypothetical protein [Kordiimonadaceae bacterium]
MGDVAADLSTARAQVEACAAAMKAKPRNKALREAWAQAAHGLVIEYRELGDVDSALGVTDLLWQAVQDHPSDDDLLARWGYTVSGCSVDLAKAGELGAAQALVEKIKRAIGDYPHHPYFWYIWTEAVSCLVPAYVAAGDLPGARALVDQMAVDAGARIEERNLGADTQQPNGEDAPNVIFDHYIDWNKAAFYLAHAYGCRGDLTSARALTDSLGSRLAEYDAFSEWGFEGNWPSLLFFMVRFYAKAGAWDEAQAMLATLENFTTRRESKAYEREYWVEAVYEIVLAYAGAQRWSQARALLDKLEEAGRPPEPRRGPKEQKRRARSLKKYFEQGGASSAWTHLNDLWEEYEEPREVENVTPTARELWVEATRILVRCYSTAGKLGAARDLLDALEAGALAEPGDKLVSQRWVQEASALAVLYGRAGFRPQAREMVERLEGNALGQDDELGPFVRAAWAKAAASLVIVYADDGDLNAGRALFEGLEAASLAHSDEFVLAELWGQATLSMAMCCAHVGSSRESQRWADALIEAAQQHPDDAKWRALEEEALGYCSLKYGSGGLADFDAAKLNAAETGDLEVAGKRAVRLEMLAQEMKAHPGSPAVREEWAQAAYALFVSHEKTRDRGAAARVCEALKQLSEAHREEPALRELWGKAVFNMIDFRMGNDPRRAQSLLRALEGARASHPDDSAFHTIWADAVFNLGHHYCEYGTLKQVCALLDRLEAVMKTLPGDAILRERWAGLVFGVLDACGDIENGDGARSAQEPSNLALAFPPGERRFVVNPTAGEFGKSGYIIDSSSSYSDPGYSAAELQVLRALLDALGRVATHHLHEHQLEYLWGGSVPAMVQIYTDVGEISAARDLLDDIAQAADRLRDGTVLRWGWAEAVGKMVFAYAYEIDRGRDGAAPARALLDALEQVMRAQPDQQTFREKWAKASAIMFHMYKSLGDETEAQHVRAALEATALQYPDENLLPNLDFGQDLDVGE